MGILKDLPELLEAKIISQETAEKIEAYYTSKKGQSDNRLFIAFGILGAILVGLGIILIIAHNWDELSKVSKTIFAFLPLLAGQLICGWILLKKRESTAWRESGSAFLFFAVGACISLISQIYNIPGDVSSFLLTWMLLCLPLVYVMRSSISSLLYIGGITYYAVEAGYWSYPVTEPYWFWILLLLILPYYYWLFRRKPGSNFLTFHNWMIPLSLTITLGTLALRQDQLMFIAYVSLFGLFYIIGNLAYFQKQKIRNNAYLVLGAIGTIFVLLILSFDWFWEEVYQDEFLFGEVLTAPEFYASLILIILAGSLLSWRWLNSADKVIQIIEPVFLVFILIYLLGMQWPVLATVLINLLVLVIGILTIRKGAARDHLGVLNYGLLIITALVISRFFDTNLSFVARGLLFVMVGVGFFIANYQMLKKRRTDG